MFGLRGSDSSMSILVSSNGIVNNCQEDTHSELLLIPADLPLYANDRAPGATDTVGLSTELARPLLLESDGPARQAW